MILLAALFACAPPEEASWLEGVTWRWDATNHRLSYWNSVATDAGASVALVGGTSTTGIAPDLADACDAGSCAELPIEDDSAITVAVGRATTRKATFGVASSTVVATAAGATDTITIPLDRRATGTPTVILQGLVVDTDHPLSGGDACYRPGNGWHPRHLAVEASGATLSDDGRSVTAQIRAAFEAGPSREDIRACVDAVIDQAQVPITLHVLAVVADAEVTTQAVSHGAVYPLLDGEGELAAQSDPDLTDRPLTLDAPLIGWSALAWDFDDDEASGRGVYLRELSFGFDRAAGWASGLARNDAPEVLQLSGISYTFEATLVGVDIDAEVTSELLGVSGWPAAVDPTTYAPTVTEITAN